MSAPSHAVDKSGGAPQPAVPAHPVELADRIRRLRGDRARVVVGIVGAPGSGKSTLAAAVVDALSRGAAPLRTALVPMDGYHLAQRVLEAAGTAEIKGAPVTFDAAGFVAIMERLTSSGPGSNDVVYAPEFRRALEEPIAGAVAVGPDVEVIITEGNYLLSAEPPWDRVAGLLAETWYLDTPDELRLERLVSRHVAFGRSPSVALERSTTGTDGRNAAYVLATRPRADLLLIPT